MRKTKIILPAILIIAIVISAFFPCLENNFIDNWDDQGYVTNNPVVKNLSFRNVELAFTSFFIANYQPITILTYILEYHFFKLDPFGYHLASLILHTLNCLLVFWLIYLLAGKASIAFLTSLLFGIHPLRVESVAWVSETKDVLYAFFFLSSLVSYYYYRERKEAKYYLASLCLFILSLLSKAMAITLPLILLLMDYLKRRKIEKKMFTEKIPFFALSFLFGALALYAQYSIGAVRKGFLLSIMEKFTLPCYSIIFYIYKLIFPLNLSCFYPYMPTKDIFLFFYPAIAVICLLVVIILSGKYTRKIIFGSLFFLICILPVLQFVPIGQTIAADRYTYIPSVGILYLFSTGFIWFFSKKLKYNRIIKATLLIAVIGITVFFSILTWQRCQVWKDSLALWDDALNKYPYSAFTLYNRGNALFNKRQYDAAYLDFINASVIEPKFVLPRINLANFDIIAGRYKEAISTINRIIKEHPEELAAYEVLAVAYSMSGDHAQELRVNKQITEKKPGYAQGFFNLCNAYINTQNFQKAINACQKAAELDPSLASAEMHLAMLYHNTKQHDLAILHYDKAIKLGYPADPEFLKSLKAYQK